MFELAGNIDIGNYSEKQVKKKEFPSIRKFFIKYLKACDLDYENIDNINKMETFYPNNYFPYNSTLII